MASNFDIAARVAAGGGGGGAFSSIAALPLSGNAAVSSVWAAGARRGARGTMKGIRVPDGDNLLLRVSTDGSTFLTSGYSQSGKHWTGSSEVAVTSTTSIIIYTGAGAAGLECVGGWFTVLNMDDTSNSKQIVYQVSGMNTAGAHRVCIGGGTIATASQIRGVQVLTSSAGNFTDGQVDLWDLSDPAA